MGFGTTDYGGTYPKQLKTASSYAYPNDKCYSTYNDPNTHLTNADMCTTNYGIDRNDTCQVG